MSTPSALSGPDCPSAPRPWEIGHVASRLVLVIGGSTTPDWTIYGLPCGFDFITPYRNEEGKERKSLAEFDLVVMTVAATSSAANKMHDFGQELTFRVT
jgi:hypothetical protein